jgi:hypothetical protein
MQVQLLREEIPVERLQAEFGEDLTYVPKITPDEHQHLQPIIYDKEWLLRYD